MRILLGLFFIVSFYDLTTTSHAINNTEATDKQIMKQHKDNPEVINPGENGVVSHAIVNPNASFINAVTSNTSRTFTIIDMFFNADLVVQIVMVVLLIASIWSWAVIFDKFIVLRGIRRKINLFEDQFWTGRSLDDLFKVVQKRNERHPLSNIFVAMFHEFKIYREDKDNQQSTIIERLDRIMRIESNKVIALMASNLSLLAIIGNISVFIGLFGMVWGIMENFQSISVMQNATIATVSPGISEALLATALALIAAIPAALFYKKFSNDINVILMRLDNFALELSNLLLREVGK